MTIDQISKPRMIGLIFIDFLRVGSLSFPLREGVFL